MPQRAQRFAKIMINFNILFSFVALALTETANGRAI